MPQPEHIEAIERRLWGAADTLRANSNYASNEYFLPVMGLVFLRHAYRRYLAVKDDIEANLPTRGGKTRELTKEDFSQKSAIFLQPKAQFDDLVALPDSEDWAKAIISAMESIEADYESLRGVLPKSEYQELDNAVLGQLVRTLNPDELKQVSGDVFGRIYEYFLTQFADQKAHDGGEFFTPISIVSLIAHVPSVRESGATSPCNAIRRPAVALGSTRLARKISPKSLSACGERRFAHHDNSLAASDKMDYVKYKHEKPYPEGSILSAGITSEVFDVARQEHSIHCHRGDSDGDIRGAFPRRAENSKDFR